MYIDFTYIESVIKDRKHVTHRSHFSLFVEKNLNSGESELTRE